MDDRKIRLEKFFDDYADRFNKAIRSGEAQPEETAAAFAECFIEANPSGVICGNNDDKFRAVIPQGYEYYRKCGITSMDIVSKEVTLLDEFHAMVSIGWRSAYSKENNKGEIMFYVIYFLQSRQHTPRIFAYITGDEQKALRERGLI